MIYIRILSLDQASKTGWSLFEDNKLINYGIVDFNHIKDFSKRIEIIKQWYINKIKETKAEIFALEDVQQQRNPNTYKKLSKLLGVLENYLINNNYFYEIVPSTKWKSTCNIKGKKRKQQKENAQIFIKNKYGITVEEDIADAICIGFHMTKKILPKIVVKNNS